MCSKILNSPSPSRSAPERKNLVCTNQCHNARKRVELNEARTFWYLVLSARRQACWICSAHVNAKEPCCKTHKGLLHEVHHFSAGRKLRGVERVFHRCRLRKEEMPD